MRMLVTFALISMALFLCSKGLAKPQFKIALIEIPGVLEFKQSKTPYNQLIDEILPQNESTIEFTYLPSARAYKLFNEGKIDCVFPVVPNIKTHDNLVLQSDPINAIGAYLFTIKTSTLPLDITQLKKSTIVYRRGYIFGSILPTFTNVEFLPVISHEAALGMLRKGRADALLAYLPDLKFVFSDEILASLRFDTSLPVLFNADRMQCHKNSFNLTLINNINTKLGLYRKSGRLEELLGTYYWPVVIE